MSSASLSGRGVQDRGEQAGETRFEVVAAQRVETRGSSLPLLDDARLTKDLEVMRAGRLRDRDVEAPTGLAVAAARQRRDDLEADRIAERVQHVGQVDLFSRRVGNLRYLG